jgi:hypothetical protein
MGLGYDQQEDAYILGDASTAVTLTTAYAGNVSSAFAASYFSQFTFCVEYTTGAGGGGNSIQIKIEGAPESMSSGITPVFFTETASATSGGVVTHTAAAHTFTNGAAATTERFFFYAPPAFQSLRVSAKETVVGGSAGTAKIRLISSGAN